MKRFLLLFVTACLAITLAACGEDAADEENQKEEDVAEQANAEVDVTEDEKVDDEEVVVNINDAGVKGKQYNLIYAQTKMQMHQFGQDINDLESIKEKTLDELIAQELVKQDAKKQGVEVTDEEVQSEFDDFKSENEEEFQAYLDEFELTEETFKDQLSFSLVLDKYLDEQIKIDEVSDEDAKEMYDNLKEQNEEIADYEELEGDIKKSLENQQTQEKLQAKLEELKESADIEKLI